uniref:Secreted protein n=1 Tax=Steinernema glaseri TaxID=37863 RepID=A0A1I8ART7_9BILA
MTKMIQSVVILAACFSLGLACRKFENASSDRGTCLGPHNNTERGQCSRSENNCAAGYTCRSNPAFFGLWECCSTTNEEMYRQAHTKTCLNGKNAIGEMHSITETYQYFVPKLAKSCGDMDCGEGNTCEQVNQYFARCCESEA